MALPALQQHASTGDPGPPAGAQRENLPSAGSATRRVDDSRRLRRVKDSKEQLKRRTRARGASSGTIDTTTTNSTAAGRSYTVANVHNGVIYLRPTVRPGNQRSRPLPDPFVFPPQTPPDSATLDGLRPTSNEWEHSVSGSRTPRSEPISSRLPEVRADNAFGQHPSANATTTTAAAGARAPAHVRSHSFSTVDEHTVTTLSTELGTVRVVIERPPFGRPKTADTSSYPLLQVPIPNYRLGTPRFSTRGTVDLRSSVYTRASGTDDFANSLLSPQQPGAPSFLSSRPHSEAYSPIPHRFRATMDRPPLPTSAPSSARVSQAPIGPRLYDALTVNPDDRAVVRFSAAGDILAATPSRLVAHITSPSFLDYELLSDFFLTFRAFLSTRDLVAYLISRLRWAVDRQDDFGRIVRVRTFVALRHWILNYFVDDFVPFYSLRVYFCDLANRLYHDLRAREDGGGGDIKIVGELKKCWRRTCASYWETEDGFGQNYADDELLPGGPAQSQASIDDLGPVPPAPSTPNRQPNRDTRETTSTNPSDQFASRHMDWAQRARHTPQNSLSSPYVPSHDSDVAPVPLSPASDQSMHVVSCSIPMRGMSKPEPAVEMPLYPHPVSAGNARVAATPQKPTSVKRNNRPHHGHKRSGSFSDALRDSRAPLSIPRDAYAEHALSAMTNIPGSLVRGGLVQPGSPYFEVKSLRHFHSQRQPENQEPPENDMQKPGHTTNPGMKKILGSVRRALSTRQPLSASPQLGGSANHRQPTSTHSSSLGVYSTASGGTPKRRAARPKSQVRIDILTATVGESFRDAIHQQLERESQERHSDEPPSLGGFEFEFEQRNSPSTARPKSDTSPDPRVHSNITSGSKSILIIDDTGAPPIPPIPSVLPADIEKPGEGKARILNHQRNISIDERMAGISISPTKLPTAAEREKPRSVQQEHRFSRTPVKRPLTRQRRSMSEGREQMHSFRRRGSTKTSIARSGSLRRHASYNSGLSRRRGPDSVGTFQTFQTMSSDNDPFQFDRQPVTEAAGPARQLRRRPGGDLRAVDNVHDLETMQRPHSTGSVSNRTHSITNSVILRSDRFIEPAKAESQHTQEVNNEEAPEKAISLIETHSSQPNLRPSFEVEVAKLAALPDDTDDEGGVESALMKLEGRYEKKSPSIPSRRVTQDFDVYQPTGAPVQGSNHMSLAVGENTAVDDSFHHPLVTPTVGGRAMHHSAPDSAIEHVPVGGSNGVSTNSYLSLPLLDRGANAITAGQPRTNTLESMRSSAKPPLSQVAANTSETTQSLTASFSVDSSIDYVVETESMKRIPKGGTLPASSVPRESFLLDENEDLSEMGSTIGARSDRTSHGVRSFFDDQPATPDDDLPTHPMRHPPTPPLTATKLHKPISDPTLFERGLPTPGLTPTVSRANQLVLTQSNHIDSTVDPASSLSTAHLPFILAYDSETLAQQFTIVEKDALDEIDWKELIELRWKQSSPQIRDWVQYLRTEEARGVDVVIARFNLVVKWVVSECLLTEDVEERARCIIKYIHIASHARQLRNYATMYQISIALISNDVCRLKKTWSRIPAAELYTMKELEALVQPLKNFHNLRLEMETATVEDGCIPFIGIYTRDLIYNAQKPAFIDAPPVDGERLVNFDRYHTAATIVKNLLRLLEASSKYTLKVEPAILSKCLWLAALSDEEITRRSRQCE